MKILKLSLIALSLICLTSCFEDRDDNAISASEINDFVWKGMNAVYLYKDEIPDLANDRFSTNQEYATYLNSYFAPEELFESLIYDRQNVDRFSIITSDYIALNQQLNGVFKTNGLEFNFYYVPGSTTEVFGIIRLVLNNSPASSQGLQRGQIVYAVDGTNLTESNLSQLFNQDTYTLNFADYNDNGTPDNVDDDTIVPNSTSSSLTKVAYNENPVHQTAIIDVDGENVGYLVYNGFNINFVDQLNAAFEEFQANNVQHLVLDLRYNPGGRVDVASYLGSMITGQFNGQVFSKLVYNSDLQELNSNYNFANNYSGNSINSLNLNKVYILTTSRTASASELVINSLGSYIDVVQIGDFTTGKTQASVTIYDSPDLGPSNINPNHFYAMQPLVANSINVNDEAVPGNGLTPDITVIETPRNFGTLGDINEPLLAAAIADIQGIGRYNFNTEHDFTPVKNRINLLPHEDEMYIDSDNFIFDRQKLNFK